MSRPLPTSPLELIEVQSAELIADVQKRLAFQLGLEKLPADCLGAIQHVLTSAREHAAHVNAQENSTTAGNVRASIDDACSAIKAAVNKCSALIAPNSGIDSGSHDQFQAAADSFISIAENRLEELEALPRIYPEKQILLATCPYLKLIFVRFAAPDFNSDRGRMWRFAFEALQAAEIKTQSIDEAHLDRLDVYLDAGLPQ
jgi:hypothetical protein